MLKSPILSILDYNQYDPKSVEERLQEAEKYAKQTQMLLKSEPELLAKEFNCMRKKGLSVGSYFPQGDEIFTDKYIIGEDGERHHEYVPEVYLKLKTVDGPDNDMGFSDTDIRKYFNISDKEWRWFKNTYFPNFKNKTYRDAYLEYGGEKARKWYKEYSGENRRIIKVEITDQGSIEVSKNLRKNKA